MLVIIISPADTHELVDQGVELPRHNLRRQHNHPYILSNIWTGSTDGDYPVVEQHPVRDEVGQTPDNDGASQHVDDAVLETVSRVIYGNVQ